MDKSVRYIKMCRAANEILKLKWRIGFQEGDYLYLGDTFGVRSIGFDFFYISGDITDEKKIQIRLLDVHDMNMETTGDSIDVKYKDFYIQSFINPIWLPRQDQMESFFYKAILNNTDINEWIMRINAFRVVITKTQPNIFKSGEQVALAFVMKEHFRKLWNNDIDEWVLGLT